MGVAFKIMNGDEVIPPAYQEILFHVIFDTKMDNFRHKARFVEGGHTTDIPHAMTYESVV
jgi:hypothetical protein